MTAPRILVVEDDSTNRMVITKMLEHLGYSPEEAEDGIQAVEAARHTEYDLILMDVMMPSLDGMQATRLIRSEGLGHPRIFAITANAMSEDRRACLSAGMDDFITKPIRMDTMRELVERGLSGSDREEFDAAVAESLQAVIADDGLFHEILQDFIDGSQALIDEFATSCAQHDWAAAERSVHSLRSTSATFGGKALEALCKKTELDLHARRYDQDFDTITEELGHLRWRLCAALTALRDRDQPES